MLLEEKIINKEIFIIIINIYNAMYIFESEFIKKNFFASNKRHKLGILDVLNLALLALLLTLSY